jgi:hypothetical protein
MNLSSFNFGQSICFFLFGLFCWFFLLLLLFLLLCCIVLLEEFVYFIFKFFESTLIATLFLVLG